MSIIEIKGVNYEVDESDFLTDHTTWTLEFAHGMAAQDDFELTDKHIKILEYFREYYLQYSISPGLWRVRKWVSKELDENVRELFPISPSTQACKYAGLPKPTGCI